VIVGAVTMLSQLWRLDEAQPATAPGS
jgi:hypothetical protein